MEPDGTEQGVQCESCQVSIDMTPEVHRFRDDSGSMSRRTHTCDIDDSDCLVYGLFNLQNINAPMHPKWKHNDHILEEYKKFHHSCQCIFDGPMAHVTSTKVKTNMFLIWCGPDGGDINNNSQFRDDEMYDTDYVMEQFELYCEPIYNFHAARYKFHQVPQREDEMMNAFYHHIQKLCVQCQFSDDEECLVDAIIYGTEVQKAREKLLQMPKHLTLCDCLKLCCHYESLQYHLNVVKPMDKPVESITKHRFNRGGRQPSAGAKKSGTFRGQPNDKPVNSANNTVQCSNYGMTHPKNQCPASQVNCFKCNRIGHYASVCRSSSSSSTQNTRQFTRFCGRDRMPQGRGSTPRRQINEATEVPEAKSNEKSDLDIVRLIEAYKLSNNSPQTSFKQRVQVDDISVGTIDIGFENIINSTTKEFTMPVLHGAPFENDVCTEWYTVEDLKPILSYIGHMCIQMEANILTDWNIDALLPKTIHLIKIDSIPSDSVYTHVTLNDKICHAKLDTGAQINVMTESLFKHIGKTNKLPLYPKSDVKFVGYGNRNIDYIGTTVVDVTHLT